VTVSFHILQSSGILTGELYNKVHASLKHTVEICSEKIKLADIDVVVMNMPWNVIPQLGVNGFSYDAHQIMLSLDSEHENLKDKLDHVLTAVLCHELHHSARALVLGSSHSQEYGGALVAEGLACCFEEEIVGVTPFYATECKGEALLKFSEKAKRHVNINRGKLSGGREQWMFGNYQNPEEFPYQCGYSTGYRLVRTWLDQNNETASSIVGLDKNKIIQAWLNGDIEPFSSTSSVD